MVSWSRVFAQNVTDGDSEIGTKSVDGCATSHIVGSDFNINYMFIESIKDYLDDSHDEHFQGSGSSKDGSEGD